MSLHTERQVFLTTSVSDRTAQYIIHGDYRIPSTSGWQLPKPAFLGRGLDTSLTLPDMF